MSNYAREMADKCANSPGLPPTIADLSHIEICIQEVIERCAIEADKLARYSTINVGARIRALAAPSPEIGTAAVPAKACKLCDWAFCGRPCETCPGTAAFYAKRALAAVPAAEPGKPATAPPSGMCSCDVPSPEWCAMRVYAKGASVCACNCHRSSPRSATPEPVKPPAKHDWECAAPTGGFFRWQCKNCPKLADYPSRGGLPDGPCTGRTPAAGTADEDIPCGECRGPMPCGRTIRCRELNGDDGEGRGAAGTAPTPAEETRWPPATCESCGGSGVRSRVVGTTISIYGACYACDGRVPTVPAAEPDKPVTMIDDFKPGRSTPIRYTYPTWFYFSQDDTAKRWAAPNPQLAPDSSLANAYEYLVRVCPDTETAIKKLRQIRAASKKYQEVG